MNRNALIISTGFALFSMFFGAGNMVFPIQLGQETAGNHLVAASGIMLTGVLVPFMGVFGMLLYGGSLQNFFSYFGKKGIFLFSLLALALMGPFGVVARCLIVSHGALKLLFPFITLPMSSLLLCVIVYILAINQGKIISLLGSIVTPFLIVSISFIAIMGLWNIEAPPATQLASWDALKTGFFQGYKTMDLLAGFFFSQFTISHLRKKLIDKGQEDQLTSIFSRSLLIGIGLMFAFYFTMVVLGAHYAPLLVGQQPQSMLGIIAIASIGSLATPFVCLALILACITSAIVLSTLFAEFLRKDICQNKLGHRTSILITVAISFGISNLDFNGISKFLGPVVEMIYPVLIILTLFNLVVKGIEFIRARGVEESEMEVEMDISAK
ncbi:MAG: branched-chain amino acid transport system II carrier protein [Parachlamydiaceae bacterium]|nr:branched-chain amino acid transport system II carrier protein [Parachlamydiaceae bacterium]